MLVWMHMRFSPIPRKIMLVLVMCIMHMLMGVRHGRMGMHMRVVFR